MGRPSWDVDHRPIPTLCGERWPVLYAICRPRTVICAGLPPEAAGQNRSCFTKLRQAGRPAGNDSGDFHIDAAMTVTAPLNLRPPPNWCVATNDAIRTEGANRAARSSTLPTNWPGCVSYPRDVEAAGLPAVSRIARAQTYPGRRCACGPRWSSSSEQAGLIFWSPAGPHNGLFRASRHSRADEYQRRNCNSGDPVGALRQGISSIPPLAVVSNLCDRRFDTCSGSMTWHPMKK